MKVPDGVREFFLFEGTPDGVTTVASVYPIAFPTSGDAKQILAWLSFCPHPPLPMIEGNKMHRFPLVPRSSIAHEILNHPQNVGDYSVNYLQPGGVFLSELNVTNNGVNVDMTFGKQGDLEVEVKPSHTLWADGYLEFRFAVLETTNCNRIAFPLRTVLERFNPNRRSKIAGDVHSTGISELVVKRVSFAASDLANRKPAPSVVIADDYRPPNLPRNRSVSYFVTNDVWQPVTDPKIQSSARRLRRNADP